MTLMTDAQNLLETTRAIRRDLHRHPELSNHEIRTAGIVSAELTRLGLEVRTGVGQTGVVGLLEGDQPGPVILLRFDMDALPIHEETGAEYASENPGVMHACGHDGHVAVGLTVARMLSERKSDLKGTYKLVFQPGEEGGNGAIHMIEDGVLENPRPDFALAMHLWNERSVGWLEITPGPMMAGGDEFTIQITGKGGHGAAPHQTVDPVVAAAQVITALQTIVSRNVSPLKTSVVTVATVAAGEAFNVIPTMVKLQGTLRNFETDVRQQAIERMEQIAGGVSAGMGCKAAVSVSEKTLPVVNDPQISRRMQDLAARDFPELSVDSTYRTMISEDMSYMLNQIPGVYLLVGSANPEKGLNYGHHHPRFDFDEQALVVGAAFMTAAALELSNR